MNETAQTVGIIWQLIPIGLLLTAVALAWFYPRSLHLVKAALALFDGSP